MNTNYLNKRFGGFYPVVIDIETSGTNFQNNALLEIAAITLKMDKKGWLKKDKIIHFHIHPFQGSLIQKKSLKLNKIDLYSALRFAVSEEDALSFIFHKIQKEIKKQKFRKAVLVAHNAVFDYNFINAAISRSKIKMINPFHSFVIFDTAVLSSLFLGQTVLARACQAVGIYFDASQAHSALYDTDQTAKLFCKIVNLLKILGENKKNIHGLK